MNTGPAPYWQSYTFDATKTLGLGNGALTGNRSTVTDHDVTGNTAKDVTRTSSYPVAGTTNIEGADPANGLGTTGTEPHLLTSVTAAGGATGTDQYTYDGAGNTTGRKLASGANQTLTWDAEERLATVTDNSTVPATKATYVYDADGTQLIRRDTGGANAGTTLYLGVTEVHLAGTSLTGNRYYAYDSAPSIVGSNSGAITYEIADNHGTGGTTVNAANGLISARRYTKPRPPHAWHRYAPCVVQKPCYRALPARMLPGSGGGYGTMMLVFVRLPYLLFCRIASWLVLLGRSGAAKDVELLVCAMR